MEVYSFALPTNRFQESKNKSQNKNLDYRILVGQERRWIKQIEYVVPRWVDQLRTERSRCLARHCAAAAEGGRAMISGPWNGLRGVLLAAMKSRSIWKAQEFVAHPSFALSWAKHFLVIRGRPAVRSA